MAKTDHSGQSRRQKYKCHHFPDFIIIPEAYLARCGPCQNMQS